MSCGWYGLGPLVRVDGQINRRYIEEILNYHVIPLLENFEEIGEYLFQQDNAPIHTSARTK